MATLKSYRSLYIPVLLVLAAALGVKLSEKETPAIAKYIQTTYKFARAGISTAKSSFARRRPYSHFKESSAIAVDENSVGEFTSYPSGHTVRAWSIAMALVAIDEAHYSGIVKVGLELGESRVITGFHCAGAPDRKTLLLIFINKQINMLC